MPVKNHAENHYTEYLNLLQLGDKGKPGSLRHLAFIIGKSEYEASKNAVKEQVVSVLSKYYCDPNRFNQLWSSLNDAERKIISLHVWGNGSEPADCADKVAEEFGIARNPERMYCFYLRNGLDRYKERYAGKDSILWLLFPQSGRDQLFCDELREAVGEMKRVYSKVSGRLAFMSRENKTSDFVSIIRYCISNKLAITKNGFLSKSSALKLCSFCGYEEYAADIGAKPEDMRTAEGLLVTFPLSVLCMAGGLLTVVEAACVPSGKALSLLDLPHEQLVKKIFEAYLKNKSFNETAIMKGIKSQRGHNPAEARQNIAKELKYCLPGQPVYMKELERHLRIVSKTFARKDEKYVIQTGSNFDAYGVEWERYEHPLIGIILSFFGALGMIDIAWGEDNEISANQGRRIPVAFRLNPLGAYALSLSDSYTAPTAPKVKNKGGFTVLPDYTVIVPDSTNRIKHELFFEKFFTKVSVTDETTIYRLDFETATRAIDNGVSIAELREYLSAADKPMPENVAHALSDWEKQAGRIRLRQVTILECDDAALLEEVVRYKGMGELVREKISAAVVVDGSAANKIKKNIEKNKRFCQHVI